MRIRRLLFGIIIFLLFDCHTGTDKATTKSTDSAKIKPTADPIIWRDSLMIPDSLFSPTTELGLPDDTLTPNGNFIHYKITNNRFCTDNIYIEWGNPHFKRIYICPGARQLRSYFIPVLNAETKDYLLLEYGCATDCHALLPLPLNKTEKPREIFDILNYNQTNLTVVRSKTNMQTEDEHEFLEAYNVRTHRTRRIIFKNSGIAARPIFLIDSCSISDREIYIRAQLYNREKDTAVQEILRLPNDIKN